MSASSAGRLPGGCRLRVAGRLDDHWARWFDGFTLTAETDGTTTLAGAVQDQAHLHALLARVRDLGIALLSVEAAPAPDEALDRPISPPAQR
jgi:hypothetical protein